MISGRAYNAKSQLSLSISSILYPYRNWKALKAWPRRMQPSDEAIPQGALITLSTLRVKSPTLRLACARYARGGLLNPFCILAEP